MAKMVVGLESLVQNICEMRYKRRRSCLKNGENLLFYIGIMVNRKHCLKPHFKCHEVACPQKGRCHEMFTLPETNMAPENGWLEYYFPIGEAYFQGLR